MYTDKEKQKEATKEAVKRYRAKKCNTQDVIPGNVIPDPVIPEGDVIPQAEKLKAFISRGDNLEKLQRIAGSLGKLSNEVYFMGMTFEDIGNLFGPLPGKYSRN